MGRSKAINAELADKIVKEVTRFIFATGRLGPHVLQMRPVIWLYEMAEEALTIAVEREALPLLQRDLCHLMCLDDEIRIIAHMPQYHSKTGEFLSALIMEYRATYEGRLAYEKPALVFAGSKKTAQRLEDMYKLAAKEFGAKISDHRILCLDEILNNWHKSGSPDDRLIPFFQACALEAFAFSPYTTIKHRLTLKQAINPNPGRKEWPAIEVVSLRLPAKREHSDPTGRKINVRYSVTEHMRRQPTRDGIKIITIEEHFRGPKDAPLKPKRPKVYKVVK